jgi:hypothetical protein
MQHALAKAGKKVKSTQTLTVALTEGINNVIWLRNLMNELRLIDRGPTVVYQDK